MPSLMAETARHVAAGGSTSSALAEEVARPSGSASRAAFATSAGGPCQSSLYIRLAPLHNAGQAALGLALLSGAALPTEGETAMGRETTQEKTMLKKLTPVLLVEEIEPCLPFWVERLGFQKTVEVPDGNKLGFVILAKDNIEIMYQSHASAEKDVPGLLQWPLKPATFLYIEVTDLDGIIQRLQGVPVAVPVRTTFYGAREIGVREPGGNVVAFAEFQR
jgi:uncharacterized glyoxalase superfamily protein PhnB